MKGIEANQAIILGCEGNFHGRTFGAISLSTDEEDSRKDYGPFLDNVTARMPGSGASGEGQFIRYGHLEDYERAFESHGEKICAVIVEPIQGEAGIVVPEATFLTNLQALCKKHNVLLICDEIQTGIARTGKLLCYEHSPNCKPDIVLLGKAISGGVLPVSCVLSSKKIMSCFTPGSHGSTYGGNPLASRVAIAALEVVENEKLVERAERLGKFLKDELLKLASEGIQRHHQRSQRQRSIDRHRHRSIQGQRQKRLGSMYVDEGPRCLGQANPRPHHQIGTTSSHLRRGPNEGCRVHQIILD